MFVNFFQVSNSRDAAEHLKFLQSVLGPYLEGYWWLAVELATSEDELPNGQEKDIGGNVSFTVAFMFEILGRRGRLLASVTSRSGPESKKRSSVLP